MGGMGGHPSMNLNMFINNMMMGGMGMPMGMPMQGMDGMFMFGHPPPPVASQDVINANTQRDTFHADENDHDDDEDEEGKQADVSGKEEMEGDGEKKKKKKKEQCSICLEEFKNGDSIRRLPCFHIFHT